MNRQDAETGALTHSAGFFRYCCAVLFVAVLLIWWGAATTTKQAGMAFADWPLSLGSINPEGWLTHLVPFLEHSHRLLGTLVGLMVLGMFSWTYLSGGNRLKRGLEIVFLVVLLALIFSLFVGAGAERESAERKGRFLAMGLAGGVVPFLWWIVGCLFRKWKPLETAGALALLLVTTQAILGGMRVTEISDTLAVIHGCLAQIFFCLLIYIVLLSSQGWSTLGFVVEGKEAPILRIGGLLCTILVFSQLIFGASMRHHHRNGLADDGILKTAGQWIPHFDDPTLTYMFLHKLTALLTLGAFAGFLGWAVMSSSKNRPVNRHLAWIFGLVLVQVALGVLVIWTGKNFWVTNFHVLNGLGILALTFAFAVRAWRVNMPQ